LGQRFYFNLKTVFCILFLLLTSFSFSQKKWTVQIVQSTEKTKILHFNDSSKILSYLQGIQYDLIKNSWALAQYDSLVWNSQKDTLKAFLYKGEKFHSIQIDIAEEDKPMIRRIPKLSEHLLAKIPFNSVDIIEMYESVIDYLENNGYPFAKVRLQHLMLNSEQATAKLIIERGILINWKEIFVKGDKKISPNFIKSYLGIKEDKAYSEKLFRDISKKLGQLNYLSLEQKPQIIFSPEGADLYLYLKNVKVSSADGILGIQPNDKGKIIFTGDINLKLSNVLKHGEFFSLNWKSLRPKTQQIEASLNAPFLFKSNFGVEGSFHLYKRDSSFLEIKAMGGIRYYLGGANYLRGFYQFESSNILSGAANSTGFSTGQTVKTSYYGLGIVRNYVNYVPNPTSGLQLDIEASVGLRKAYPLDSAEQKRTVKSTSSKIRSTINYYIPIGRRHTIKLSNTTSAFYADTVYSNEVLRFGGLKAQRGFNEESLYATFFTTFSLEYRFLLDKNSNIFAFYDQSWYENNSGKYYKDAPFGFGLGVSFGTKVGIFSLSYALGKQFSNPLSFKDGKIHFGYIAYF
jgi:hypothetical protein